MKLIVVESPTKAKTLTRFLGADYAVEASFGHVRDLPEKKIGIKIDEDFKPEYVQTEKQKKRTDEIRKISDKAEWVYLATDPDREGEAIAWHVGEMLKKGQNVSRIAFHEITQKAIGEALENPREIDMKLVNAQQARRILDRLVGYKLSPLLWRKVRKGLSAGRVQSVAVRLVVEKEREIEKFVPEEFWNMQAELAKIGGGGKMLASVLTKNGEKLAIVNQDEANIAETQLRGGEYKVAAVDRREVKRTPPAPFTTSTLQQAAANKLGWSAKRTMQVAQSLYEEGLITYHRTDSTNLALEAVTAAADYLKKTFGADFALAEPRTYKTKSKVAQEAHEAIRPTDIEKSVLSGGLGISNREELRLYELIWKRFLACQAAESLGEETKIKVMASSQNDI
jgi:DNA topoisomerase-1